MSHTMKLWERDKEHRLHHDTSISLNQFGFKPSCSTMEAIFLIRSLVEKYRDVKKDLHMVFIDLEKAYDSVLRDVLWRVSEQKRVSIRHIQVLKHMYERTTTIVRIVGGDTKDFPISIGLHQGSAVSPYLFYISFTWIDETYTREYPLVHDVYRWYSFDRWDARRSQ